MDLHLSDGQFCAGVFNSDVTFRGQTRTQPRRVELFELEFFREDGGVTYLDGREIPIRAGLILCAKPGQVRHSRLPLRTFYLKVRQEPGELCDRLSALPDVIRSAAAERLCDSVREILEAEEAGDALLCAGLFLSLLSRVTRAAEKEEVLAAAGEEKNRRAIGAALLFMEEHLGEKCTLSDVAAAAHFSPIYFHGLFCKAVGKTPQEYLTELRIAKAKHLLFASNADAAEIAAACGFSSQSYFDYVFRKVTGETPRGYRKRMHGRYENKII